MMAVPAAVPVEVKMASAKGEESSTITAREQTRTRLGRPMAVMRSKYNTGTFFCSTRKGCYLGKRFC